MQSNSSGYGYLLRRHRSTPSRVVKIKCEPEDKECTITAVEKDCGLKVKSELLAEVTPTATSHVYEEQLKSGVKLQQYVQIITESIANAELKDPQHESEIEADMLLDNHSVPSKAAEDPSSKLKSREQEKCYNEEFENSQYQSGIAAETPAPALSSTPIVSECLKPPDGQTENVAIKSELIVGEELANSRNHIGTEVNTPVTLMVANPFANPNSSRNRKQQRSNKMKTAGSGSIDNLQNEKLNLGDDDAQFRTKFVVNANLKLPSKTEADAETPTKRQNSTESLDIEELEKSQYPIATEDVTLLVENPFANINSSRRKCIQKASSTRMPRKASEQDCVIQVPRAATTTEYDNSRFQAQHYVQMSTDLIVNAGLENLQHQVKTEDEIPITPLDSSSKIPRDEQQQHIQVNTKEELQNVHNQIAIVDGTRVTFLDVLRDEHQPYIQSNDKLITDEALQNCQHQFEIQEESPVTLLVENPFAGFNFFKRKLGRNCFYKNNPTEAFEQFSDIRIKRELLSENTHLAAPAGGTESCIDGEVNVEGASQHDVQISKEYLDNEGLIENSQHQIESDEEMPIMIMNANLEASNTEDIEEPNAREEQQNYVQNNDKLIDIEEFEDEKMSIRLRYSHSVGSDSNEEPEEAISRNEQRLDIQNVISIANENLKNTPNYPIKVEMPLTPILDIHSVTIAENPKLKDEEQEPVKNDVIQIANEDSENAQCHIGSQDERSVTILYENPLAKVTTKTKSCDIVLKMEPTDVLETILSEWNGPISTSSGIKQEYLELPNVQIPDVKEDTPMDIESSPIMKELYVDTDVKPRNLFPTCSFTVIDVPSSQEENLLMPRSQSIQAKTGGCRTGAGAKSNLDKRRRQNKKKRRNIDLSYKFWKKCNTAITVERRNTRNKTKKQNMTEFTQPLKLERLQIKSRRKSTETDIATDLPRPIESIKMESIKFNTKKPQTYTIKALQPLVRIKRLNWNHIGVVKSEKKQNYKSRMWNMARLPQHFQHTLWNSSTDDVGQRIRIQNAFSLNPGVQEKRRINESQRLIQSASPGTVSTATSSHCDSGVSTSSHGRRDNANILLEIAAERAFINHHLTRFGFSPVQFELYNNFNDLSVFLKYLFGPLITNQK